MSIIQSFAPLGGANNTFANSAAITIGAANVTIALPNTGTAAQVNNQLLLFNNSSAVCYVTTGNTAANAVAVAPTSGSPANGLPLAPGSVQTVTIPPGALFIGVIGTAGGGTLFVTQGEGV